MEIKNDQMVQAIGVLGKILRPDVTYPVSAQMRLLHVNAELMKQAPLYDKVRNSIFERCVELDEKGEKVEIKNAVEKDGQPAEESFDPPKFKIADDKIEDFNKDILALHAETFAIEFKPIKASDLDAAALTPPEVNAILWMLED